MQTIRRAPHGATSSPTLRIIFFLFRQQLHGTSSATNNHRGKGLTQLQALWRSFMGGGSWWSGSYVASPCLQHRIAEPTDGVAIKRFHHIALVQLPNGKKLHEEKQMRQLFRSVAVCHYRTFNRILLYYCWLGSRFRYILTAV